MFCTLVKLRLNLHFFDLAYSFQVSDTTIQNIVVTYVYSLDEVLFKGTMNTVPSGEKNSLMVAACFRYFPNCRMVLDCTEIERYTFKVLIGIAPNATITYVSDLFPGSTSDKAITKKSGILHHLKVGDLILADKGFLIKDMCSTTFTSVSMLGRLTYDY
ncbi:hypothetical protein FQR65_LT14438 [Abscondita terminalis]|nr:hypothetical protein FQR65_LT14438 [Abscondita terminalis]